MNESAPISGNPADDMPGADKQDIGMVRHVVSDYHALAQKIRQGVVNKRLTGDAWEVLAGAMTGTALALEHHFGLKAAPLLECNLCSNPVAVAGSTCQPCMDALRVKNGFPRNPAAPATPFAELR